jgi:HEAT repeat protein
VTAIAVIGRVGNARAVPRLASLVGDPGLSPPERIALACALGEIGGDGAQHLLRRMQAAIAADDGELHREIEIALAAATASPSD